MLAAMSIPRLTVCALAIMAAMVAFVELLHVLVEQRVQRHLPPKLLQLLETRSLPMRFDALPDGRARIMTSLGNPALWWLVNGSLLLTGALAAWGLFRARRLRAWLSAVDPRPLLLFVCWCAPIAPWIVSPRDSYIYHYLPAYAFGVVLAAGWLSRLYRKLPPHGLIALLALGQVSFYYAPIWGQLPITRDGIERRLFVKSWR